MASISNLRGRSGPDMMSKQAYLTAYFCFTLLGLGITAIAAMFTYEADLGWWQLPLIILPFVGIMISAASFVQ